MIAVTAFPALYCLLAWAPGLNRAHFGAGLLGLAQLGLWLLFWAAGGKAANLAMFIVIPLDLTLCLAYTWYRRKGPEDTRSVLKYRYLFSPVIFFGE